MTNGNGDGFSQPADEWFFYLLFQTVRRREAAFAGALGPLGLDMGKWRALSVVRRLSGCTMNELADFTTIDRTTLTRTADQLAAAGLVVRQGSPADRRRVCLTLTPAGEALFAQALEAMRSFNQQALDGVEPDELDNLRNTLGKVLHNVTRSPPRARAILEFAKI